MSVRIVHTLPPGQWRDFVDIHPSGNIFHTPDMFEVFRCAKWHDPELWAALEGDRILALFIPVHISLKGGILRRLTARSVSFGSVLSVPGERGEQALRQLLDEYQKTSGRRSLFTEMRNIAPLGDSLKILEMAHFVYEEHLNFLINLDLPPDEVFHNIGARTRKNIKKGINKALVKVEEVQEGVELGNCYRLLDMTYRAAHVPLADLSLFEAAFEILRPKRMARFTAATVENQPVAASIELVYKDVVYGWYGGVDRTFAHQNPNELLMWDILKWGTENGFKKYDFGGAGKPGEKYRVRDFKAKFGGELVCYGRNVWVPNPALLSISKLVYQAVRYVVF